MCVCFSAQFSKFGRGAGKASSPLSIHIKNTLYATGKSIHRDNT